MCFGVREMSSATDSNPLNAVKDRLLARERWPLYVAGKAEQPNADLVVTDKYGGEAIAHVALADASVIERAIAGSELVVFAGHSHLVQVERPREVHATIERFLAHHRL